MDLDLLTRQELLRYQDRSITLDEFRGWFRAVQWKLGDAETRARSPLARAVALYIAEYNLGHRTEVQLRGLLEEAASTVHVEVAGSLYDLLRWSVAETISAEVPVEARTPRVEGFELTTTPDPQKERQTTRVPRGLARSR